jgi:hypothetical protein
MQSRTSLHEKFGTTEMADGSRHALPEPVAPVNRVGE